ncbi:hypothetical protein F5B17DRAFT_395612 [Nemania serpens]|nr:hypothetical protein F5B17DRAFT_395612 [Nemania serpens]
MAGRGLGASATLRNEMLTSRVGQAGINNDDEEDELALPIVFSDISRTSRPQSKKFLSSVTESPQTPNGARMSQQTAVSANEPSPSQPRMRLAVHIRSSPVTPFTPINAPTPHGSSNFSSRLGQPQGRTATAQTRIRPPSPDFAGLGMSAGASAKASVKVPNTTSEPKKRGRPKGWKPGTPYTTDPNSRYRKREMQAAELQAQGQGTDQGRVDKVRDEKGKDRSQNQETRRRGRPPRPPEPTIREQYLQSNPDYIPFKCEWELSISDDPPTQGPSICPAELQNMETLRRHVFIVHGDQELLGCGFPHCRDRDPPLRFKTEDEFEHHMETRHFPGFLWHMGDGYQNKGIETLRDKAGEVPAYLLDKDGSQVTPSVADQRVESDLQRKERKRRLRRLLYQQNENAPSEEEWRQQMMGIA